MALYKTYFQCKKCNTNFECENVQVDLKEVYCPLCRELVLSPNRVKINHIIQECEEITDIRFSSVEKSAMEVLIHYLDQEYNFLNTINL